MSEQKNPLPQLLLIFVACFFGLGMDKGCAIPIVAPINPPPFKADKLCVLVVEETTARNSYTAGQREVILSTDGARAYVKAKGDEFYVLDKDTPMAHTAQWVQDAMKAAQPNMLPWMVAANPTKGTSQQLPADAAATLAPLKKIGGE